ncbi:MAG: DUF5916 domain-containing protein [bacterium]
MSYRPLPALVALLAMPLAAQPTLTASRRTSAITLDGKLDEADWAAARLADGFVQRFPDPGRKATMQTAVRVLYDDEAIYVGARMYDPHPDSITAPLARRDPGNVNSDWFDVIFDSYHDRRTAFRFATNPVGTKLDVYHFNDGDDDNSWDPRWEVATRIDSLGWTAEFRIPLSQLRFHGSTGEQVWGLQFYRAVARHNEWTFWSPYPPTAPGFVSNFGDLRGLVGLSPPSPIEVAPYVSSRTVSNRTSAGSPFTNGVHSGAAAGADFRIGLGSALSITGAINPDFGQVEVDPAVLSLSAVETFFPEKRPFFLEGSGIFEFGALPVNAAYGFSRFVHWRRIGRTPQLSPNAEWSDVPENTTILGAAKLSGQTSNGWSLGVLDATAQRENADVQSVSGVRSSAGVEPLTNYFVGRVKRDLDSGRTTLGLLATSTTRSLDSSFAPFLRANAHLLGIDGARSTSNRRWTLGGSWIGSRVEGSTAAIAATQHSSVRYLGRPDAPYAPFDPTRTSLVGHDAMLGVVYQGTPLFGSVQLRETTPGFEMNDLGYESRSDFRSLAAAVGATHDASANLLRSTRATAYTINAWNLGGDAFHHELGITGSAELRSYWQMSARAAVLPSVLDDRATRGGPLMLVPQRWTSSASVASDSRRTIIGRVGASFAALAGGGSDLTLWPSVTVRPSPSLQLSFSATVDNLHDEAQYIRTVGHDYVFATLREKTLAMSGRIDWTLSTALSVQMFVQPFVATANLSSYKALRAAGTFAFDVYGGDRGSVRALADGSVEIDPDGVGGPRSPFTLASADHDASFLSRALRLNGLIRWEYRSGSVLYLVWQQTRDGQAVLDDSSLRSGFDGVARVPAKDVVILKATYQLGR